MTDARPTLILRLFRWLRILSFVLAGLGMAAYAAVLIWFRLNEDALIFHPDRGPLTSPPRRLDLDSREVRFPSLDATPLVARLIPPPPEVPPDGAGWILYLHGASGNVGTLRYNEAWARFRRLGLGVLAVDYRGYGESGGVPSEVGMYADAEAAHLYLTEHLHVAPSRILVYGYSLGAAVAIELAGHVPAAGLIVEGAFLSVPARGAELYPFLPVAWLARNRFPSSERIGRVGMPKLVIHARDDVAIPIAHGRGLFALAGNPKTFQEVAGGHTTAFQVDPAFFVAVARFAAAQGLLLVSGANPLSY